MRTPQITIEKQWTSEAYPSKFKSFPEEMDFLSVFFLKGEPSLSTTGFSVQWHNDAPAVSAAS